MIGFFPEPYEDELLYSWLARYAVRTGYMRYVFAAEDLFKSRVETPRIEFINRLTEDAVKAIRKHKSIEMAILENTMFPYYARFVSKERRQQAFISLNRMDAQHYNYMPVPNRKTGFDRKLRYCPACAKEDRERFGETYWHRVHQLVGISVCPKHHCLLMDTELTMLTKVSPAFITAEETVPQGIQAALSDNDLEIAVAEYLDEVFNSEFDFETCTPASALFYRRLIGTKYLSARGEQRNLVPLVQDFSEYYSALITPHITEWVQIQKLMQGKRLNPYEVCLMAMFLKITPYDLTHINVPNEDVIAQYDKKIRELHAKGLKYPSIAREIGGSYDYVKAIGEGFKGKRKKKERVNSAKTGKKPINTPEVDKELLPIVQAEIRKVELEEKPLKLSIPMLEKRLGFAENKIRALPLCYAEVQRHLETQEQFWERKVDWAVRQIKSDNKVLNLSNIIKITNMSRRDIERTYHYLSDGKIKEILEQVL